MPLKVAIVPVKVGLDPPLTGLLPASGPVGEVRATQTLVRRALTRAHASSLPPGVCFVLLVALVTEMDGTNATRRTKILFVCARNKIRSVTAEKMFAGSHLYDVKSRGVGKEARVRLTEKDLHWADLVFVMEKNHKARISEQYREAASDKMIVCLFIEDIYEPMEEALIDELRLKLAPYLELPPSSEDPPV